MVRVTGYLLLMGITYYLGGMYWSPPLLVLFFTEAVLGAVMFIQSRFLLLGAGVEVQAASEDMEKGKTVKASVKVQNRSILPVNRICVTVCCESGGQQEKQKLYGVLPARGNCQIGFKMRAAHCGKMLFSVSKIKGYDCLGLFCHSRGVALKKEFLILPEIEPMDLVLRSQELFWYPQEGEIPTGEPGTEPSDYELREYQEGDHQKNIHWKLQARTDELWTRSCHSGREPWTAVCLELAGIRQISAEQKDAWLEILSGLSAGLLEKGWKHKVYWYEEALGQFTVHGIVCREDIVRLQCILLELMQAPAQKTQHWQRVLRRSFHELPSYLLSFSTDLTLAVNERTEIQFTVTDYREMCRRRWIIE